MKPVHYVDKRGSRFDRPYYWQQVLCRKQLLWDVYAADWKLTRLQSEVTCEKCLHIFEAAQQHERHRLAQLVEDGKLAARILEQDRLEVDIWYFVDRVLEGRQGAARGAEPVLLQCSC